MNGRRHRLDRGSFERNRLLYVDGELFTQLTNGDFKVYGRRGNDGRWGNDRYDRNSPYDPQEDRRGRDSESVYWNGRELRFDRDEMPFRVGGTLMVPFRATGSLIGARTDRTEDGKRVIIRSGRNEVVYDRGRDWYRLNKVRHTLPTPARDRGNVFFVPIELFDAVTDGRLSWGRR